MVALYNHWEEACKALVLEECSQTDAYLRAYPDQAGKKRSTLYSLASKFFNRPKVKERIGELRLLKERQANERFAVDAAYVLQRLVEIDQMDIADILTEDGTLKPPLEWPKIWRQFVSQFDIEELFAGRGDERLQVGMLKKLKWPDKLRSLEMLGKHVSVSAFKEIQEHRGPGGGPVQLITREMTQQEAAEAYAATLHDG